MSKSLSESYKSATANTQYKQVYRWLNDNKFVEYTDTYPSVLTFYSWLKKKLFEEFKVDSYSKDREYRKKLSEFCSLILLPIRDRKITLKKAPTIERTWIEKFSEEKLPNHLSLSDFFALNSSWQAYSNGIFYSQIDRKIHPWHDVYYPRRVGHLDLLDSYLAELKNERKLAFDIGVGSGVLSFLLAKHNFKKIVATDINVNAVLGMEEELERMPSELELKSEILVQHKEFFPDGKADLIVCNPPWLQEDTESKLDLACLGSRDFLEQFFIKVTEHMKTNSDLILIFSNYNQLVYPNQPNWIEYYSSQHKQLKLVNRIEKSVTPYRKKTDTWRVALRKKEKIQLWHFQFNDQ